MNKDKMLSRLRKLKEMTIENGCTEAEAIAAAEKLGALLTEHNISMSEIEMKDKSDMDFGQINDPKRKRCHPVIFWSLWAVAKYTDTVVYLQGSTKPTFFGHKHDVEVALYLCLLFHNVAEADYRIWSKDRHPTPSMRTSFMSGFANRVGTRLSAMKDAQNATVAQSRGRELMVVKVGAVKSAFEDTGIRLGKAKKRQSHRDADSYLAGSSAGDRCNITTGIGRGESAKQISA